MIRPSSSFVVRSLAAAAALSHLSACAPQPEGEAPSTRIAAAALNRGVEYPEDATVTVTTEGCGETTSPISPDHEAVTLIFSEAAAWRFGQEVNEVHCRVALDYTFPAGWRFSRPAVITRGYHALAERTSAEVNVRARLDGSDWMSEPTGVQGPLDDNFLYVLASGVERGEAPTSCGAVSARIELELDAIPGGPGDLVTFIDSLDTELDWERCP